MAACKAKSGEKRGILEWLTPSLLDEREWFAELVALVKLCPHELHEGEGGDGVGEGQGSGRPSKAASREVDAGYLSGDSGCAAGSPPL